MRISACIHIWPAFLSSHSCRCFLERKMPGLESGIHTTTSNRASICKDSRLFVSIQMGWLQRHTGSVAMRRVSIGQACAAPHHATHAILRTQSLRLIEVKALSLRHKHPKLLPRLGNAARRGGRGFESLLVHQKSQCLCDDFAFLENEHFVHFVLGRLLVDSRRVGRLPLLKAQKWFLQLGGVEAAPGGQAAQKPRDRCQRDARSTKKLSGEIEISPSPLFA
jgi:hypothetical protein